MAARIGGAVVTPEGDLVRAVLDFLPHVGVWAWRNNSGMLRAEYKGKERVVRYGFRGSSDILGIGPGGVLVCVECKTATGRLSAYQHAFLQEIRERGGIAVVVRPTDYTEVITEALAKGGA
jgi:hypothetical protein